MVDIAINKDCRRDVRTVGDEKTPVIIIDDPISSTQALVDFAVQNADFGSGDQFAYPGIRAALPEQYARALVPELIALISHVYNVPRSLRPHVVHQLYSLITTRPEDLKSQQRLPHTDNRSPYYFATVHYLSATAHAGTGFFRHRPTGFERITEERYPAYVEAATEHLDQHGPPAEKYIDDSDNHYELIATVDHKPNRIIMYPGNLLHSGLINPDRDVDDNPESGRLTANLFLYFAGN